jgi:hypothetical protein
MEAVAVGVAPTEGAIASAGLAGRRGGIAAHGDPGLNEWIEVGAHG